MLRLPFIQCCCRHQIRLRPLPHRLRSHYLQRRSSGATSRLRLLLPYSCFLHCTARFDCSRYHGWGGRGWRFVESIAVVVVVDVRFLLPFGLPRGLNVIMTKGEAKGSGGSEASLSSSCCFLCLAVSLSFFFCLSLCLASSSAASAAVKARALTIMFLLLTKLSPSFFPCRRWFWKGHGKPLTHFLQPLVYASLGMSKSSPSAGGSRWAEGVLSIAR